MNKIDTSLKERKEIIKHLKKVEQKRRLTLKELKGIGDKLSKMGKLKTNIILKSFDLTKNKEMLRRYSFLMGYLKDESFIDPLLERYFTNEKNENHRSAILTILKNFDIDVSGLLINDVFDSAGSSFESLCHELLSEAEKNDLIFAYFIEEMFFLDDEYNEIVLKEFLRVGGKKALPLLEAVAGSGDEALEKIAIGMIGRFRDKSSADILNRIKYFALNGKTKALAERNLRKLSFLRIYPEEIIHDKVTNLKNFTACLGGIDGNGNRGLWIYFKNNRNIGININLLLNEEWGIVDCYGVDSISKREFEMMTGKIKREEHAISIPFDYTVALINDSLTLNLAKAIPFPPEFVIRKKYLDGLLGEHKEYTPVFDGVNLERIKNDRFYLHASGSIFKLQEFQDWVVLNSVIFDYVNIYKKLKKTPSINKEQIQHLFKKVYEEVILDKIILFKKRLMLMAEFYYKFYQRKKTLSMVLLSAALNLDRLNEYPYAVNPFIRGLIVQSLENACQILEEKHDSGELNNGG